MPPAVDRTPERSAVIAVLRRHGLSGDAISQIWGLSREMRSRTRRRGLEHAAMVNVETGTTVGRVISGEEDAVDLRLHVAAIVRDRRYVQFHTHPGNTSFSDADVAVLLSWDQIQAVGVDGTWYALSRVDGPKTPARKAADAFLSEFNRLRDAHPDLPLRELTHQIWLTIADRLGLRYDRVQRSET